MNEILQKRIEEASIEYTMKTRPMCIAGDAFADMARELNKNPAFIAGANYALQNQWISIDEALPLKRQKVLVAVLDTKSNTHFFGFDTIDDDEEFLRDKNGFAIENDSHKITHWMEFPQLEGGEK